MSNRSFNVLTTVCCLIAVAFFIAGLVVGVNLFANVVVTLTMVALVGLSTVKNKVHGG